MKTLNIKLFLIITAVVFFNFPHSLSASGFGLNQLERMQSSLERKISGKVGKSMAVERGWLLSFPDCHLDECASYQNLEVSDFSSLHIASLFHEIKTAAINQGYAEKIPTASFSRKFTADEISWLEEIWANRPRHGPRPDWLPQEETKVRVYLVSPSWGGIYETFNVEDLLQNQSNGITIRLSLKEDKVFRGPALSSIILTTDSDAAQMRLGSMFGKQSSIWFSLGVAFAFILIMSMSFIKDGANSFQAILAFYFVLRYAYWGLSYRFFNSSVESLTIWTTISLNFIFLSSVLSVITLIWYTCILADIRKQLVYLVGFVAFFSLSITFVLNIGSITYDNFQEGALVLTAFSCALGLLILASGYIKVGIVDHIRPRILIAGIGLLTGGITSICMILFTNFGEIRNYLDVVLEGAGLFLLISSMPFEESQEIAITSKAT